MLKAYLPCFLLNIECPLLRYTGMAEIFSSRNAIAVRKNKQETTPRIKE
ncbi:hypothetical protein EC843_102379 [Buttiauxella sp. JUb87]|nr:hypothetical protein EC843_102379 [Buttiauxella sp. JUb87]